MDYKNSGVDIEAGYKSVELMKEHVKKTMRSEVLGCLLYTSGGYPSDSVQPFGVKLGFKTAGRQ